MDLSDEKELETLRKEGIERKFDYMYRYISSKVRITFTLLGFCVTSMIFLFSFSKQYRVLGEVLIFSPFVLFLAILLLGILLIRLSKIENLLVSISDLPYFLKKDLLNFVEKSKKIYNFLIFLGVFLYIFGVTFVLLELISDVMNWIFLIVFCLIIVTNWYEGKNMKETKINMIKSSLEIIKGKIKEKKPNNITG